ncbi:MAG: bifunctional (p)ppGpp synthetase/guanosine-3',5'-bis(diphosphate) 3'-pyrophosphohydrolase [Bacteroidales bacterium]|nr:bifunctional (p)ppGpp synthetase/guanosine-3',5'-bis(diphosphate) 3'-pyrophosphohydrolase [Bacteroidales bacterium]
MNRNEDKIRKKLDELLAYTEEKGGKHAREFIQNAWDYAVATYKDKTTPEGFPFFEHHIEVATLALKEINLGVPSAICALLHSMDVSNNEISEHIKISFGKNVLEIIQGFQKISSLHTERVSFQSDTFRNLFLSMIDDIRVILLLMAHRLNDVRRPFSLTKSQKIKFFDEIKFIYIPIAHRLGLYRIKSEMEETLMQYEQPEIYKAIFDKIKATKQKREVYIHDFIKPIEKELIENGFEYQIKWRTKSVPSIWEKMKKQNVEFEEVYDLFAIRVIVNSKSKNKEKEDCWRVYSLVTNIYNPNPKRLRDWVTTPKASGYESLHTTVMGPDNKWVEVQIRTTRMDEIAEKGQAAHWQYKGLMRSKEVDDWLVQVRDVLEHPEALGDEYAYRPQMNQEFIFVFTPKGDLRRLPMGSTVLDFSYDIHTTIGNTCSGARVNNRVVPIRHILKNGDRVDIITTKNQKPKTDWLAFVATAKARNHIKRQLKEEKYAEAEIGKGLLQRKLRNWKLKSSDDLINYLVKHFKLDTSVELYYLLAIEKLDLSLVKSVLKNYLTEKQEESAEEIVPEKKSSATEKEGSDDILYIGDNVKNVNYRFAKCCNPVPGDQVFGFVTNLGSISIHRNNCPNAKRLNDRYPYRVLEVKWINLTEKAFYIVNIKILGQDSLGLVEAVTRTISNDLRINMRSISFQTIGKRFEGKVNLMIKDDEHLTQLEHKLMQIKGVEKIVRVK